MDKGIKMQKEIAMGIESKKEIPAPRKAKFACGGKVKAPTMKKGKK